MYKKFFKRFFDFVISVIALLVLLPLLFVLTVLGAFFMKGNPFFTQKRPGKIDKKTGKEKIFRLIKFRTMSNEKDNDGNLLPDERRLNKYGKILRATSLDELPELLNVFAGQMSLVGPRPLLVKYLPYYTSEERRRHTVRPGLTGYAQINGRNNIGWEERFQMDIWYVDHISFKTDALTVLKTFKTVFNHDEISKSTSKSFDDYRKNIGTTSDC